MMRMRHLTALGFNVVSLDYTKLCELKVHPSAIREYVKEKILDAGYH